MGRWELKYYHDFYFLYENYRYCYKCKLLLKKELFYKSNLNKTKTQNYCKVCMYKMRYKINDLSERNIKLCLRCSNLLSYDKFYKNVRTRNGVHKWCIECSDEINKNYGSKQESQNLTENIRKYEQYFKGTL